jgi:hypothetical protein
MIWIESIIGLFALGISIGAASRLRKLRAAQIWYDQFKQFWHLDDNFDPVESAIYRYDAESVLFGRKPEIPFPVWLALGVSENWISTTCVTHDSVPLTPYEYAILSESSESWIADLHDRHFDSDTEDENDLPCIRIARILGQDGELLTFGVEDIEQQIREYGE